MSERKTAPKKTQIAGSSASWRVMATGGAGFPGTAVVRQLREAGTTDRAREAFGFTAATSYEAGLKRTIGCYELTRGVSS